MKIDAIHEPNCGFYSYELRKNQTDYSHWSLSSSKYHLISISVWKLINLINYDNIVDYKTFFLTIPFVPFFYLLCYISMLVKDYHYIFYLQNMQQLCHITNSCHITPVNTMSATWKQFIIRDVIPCGSPFFVFLGIFLKKWMNIQMRICHHIFANILSIYKYFFRYDIIAHDWQLTHLSFEYQARGCFSHLQGKKRHFNVCIISRLVN